MALDGDEVDDDDDCDILACGRRMYAMIKTLNNHIGLWPQSADDDDTCLNVNIVLWPQDVLTSLAQESPGEPRRAQENPGEPRRAQ